MNNSARAFESSGRNEHKDIHGWGADLSPKDRPGIPREANQQNVLSAEWAEIPKQKRMVKVYKTLERSEITPVFGSTCPPSGLSGKMRDAAFLYSEDKIRHWMLLLFADRVNMVEGWFDDIAKGKMPMILPRMEFRTLDHARRAINQGPKGRDDYVALATVGVLAAGLGVATLVFWRGARKIL